MQDTLLIVLTVVTILIGSIIRKKYSKKVSYLLHAIVLALIFIATYSYSFTTSYEVQTIPWSMIGLIYSIPVIASLVLGLLMDASIYIKKTRKN
ncbi:MAG: hypothetical protein AB7U79_06665 [Candidatus Izemoplasmatales bacterium]